MLVDIGLKFYAVPSRPILGDLEVKVTDFIFLLKFSVKVFRSLYLLNIYIDQVHTLHVGRYWSEVLYCTIMTHPG